MRRTVVICPRCRSVAHADIDVDLGRNEMRVGAISIALEPREAELMACLVGAGGGIVRHAAIVIAIWGARVDGEPDSASNAVKVYVSRLRAKLRRIAAPVTIRNVPTIGYALDDAQPRAQRRMRPGEIA